MAAFSNKLSSVFVLCLASVQGTDDLSMGSNYGYDGYIDELRGQKGDLSHIDKRHHIFLDYAGTGLYRQSQVEASARMLVKDLYANPHSLGGTPTYASMQTAIELTLYHFNAPFDDNNGENSYEVVLTSSATGALRSDLHLPF